MRYIILGIATAAMMLGATSTLAAKKISRKDHLMVFSPLEPHQRPDAIVLRKSPKIPEAPILFTKIGSGSRADEKSAAERDAPIEVKIEGKSVPTSPPKPQPLPSGEAVDDGTVDLTK